MIKQYCQQELRLEVAIEVLISKDLIDSYISHDLFISVNNALREYNDMDEAIKSPKNK